MRVNSIEIKKFRNITYTKFDINQNLNVFFGANASGKTSILEAIYLLSNGSSFRTKKLKEVIQFGSTRLFVKGIVGNQDEVPINIGISIGNNYRKINISGEEIVSRAELAQHLPVQVVNPGSFLVLEGSPVFRRQFLDWGIFYLQSSFIGDWKKFKRALSQRNILLKKDKLKSIEIWDFELAKYGTIVNEYREQYLTELKPYFVEISKEFLPSLNFDFRYTPGWDTKYEYSEVLVKEKRRDRYSGFTQSGPHKADFEVLVENQSAKKYISRGQLKILLMALKIAQLELLKSKLKKHGCFLIDDICAELDHVNLEKLKGFINEIDLQCFVTGLEKTSLGIIDQRNSSEFEINNGCISPV